MKIYREIFEITQKFREKWDFKDCKVQEIVSFLLRFHGMSMAAVSDYA